MTQLTAAFPTARASSGPTAHVATAAAGRRSANLSDEALNTILGALERIRFGSVAITMHEGRVVQVDITEKKRLTA